MRKILLVFAVVLALTTMCGCLGTSQGAAPQVSSQATIATESVAHATPVANTYCMGKVIDKCKNLDNTGERFFLEDGRQLRVASECSSNGNYCVRLLYNKITVGNEYVFGLQDGVVVNVYTIQEATESCELRPYVTGKACGT